MLTPDPLGGRIEGAKARLDTCDHRIAPDRTASALIAGRERRPYEVVRSYMAEVFEFHVSRGGRA